MMITEQKFDETRKPWIWHQVWKKALFQPTEQGYREIADSPRVSKSRPVIWLSASALVVDIVYWLLLFALESFGSTQSGGDRLFVQKLLSFLLAVPLAAGITVVVIAFVVWITNLTARALGGEGTFERLFYTQSAFTAPFLILYMVLAFVPCINLLIMLYPFWPFVLSVRAVHRISWSRAIVAAWFPILTAIALVVFFLVGALALLSEYGGI